MLYRHLLALVVAGALFAATFTAAGPLHIATWNVEHLNEDNNAGCIPRNDDDYAYIAQRIRELNAEVVAIQEVESAEAAYRVFPEDQWTVIMSDRPNNRGAKGGNICWGTQDKRLRHQATGFAIRKGVAFTRLDAYSHLAGGDANQRWGADLKVHHDGKDIRVLSVHLASGCWGPEQDQTPNRANICITLRGQIERMVEWIQARNSANEHFVILGDFNRRLALPNDWAAERLLDQRLETTLVTANLRDGKPQEAWCDERYPDLIDHIIISNPLSESVLKSKTKEYERGRESPDHCIIATMIE